jgi:hypothetical protein
VWLHVPNGGWRHHVEAARFVGLGVRPGVADLILLHEATFFALEIKAHSKSRVSPAQRQFIAAVRAQGGKAEIAFGLDHALRVLENWHCAGGRYEMCRRDLGVFQVGNFPHVFFGVLLCCAGGARQ